MKRVNATDIVVNSIKEAIETGKLHVGDQLPKEEELASQLGVGRSSLREGMKILAAYGVVESRQGEGTFIVDHSAENFSEFLGFFPGDDKQMTFLELRRVIEVGNIVAVCGKATPEDIKNLAKLVHVFDEPREEKDYVEADKDFHAYLLNMLHNPMLTQISNMIMHMREDMLWHLFTRKEIVEDARVAHHKILNALQSRDLEACINAVSEHLDTTVGLIPLVYEKKEKQVMER